MNYMEEIACIHTDFTTKFGIPRQSGIIDALKGEIRFAPKYRDPSALRGLEGFSHIWLIWKFSEAVQENWSPTIRPPRLGGNKRMGVFATRSPFRPNPIGLSCVKLERIELNTPDGPILHVSGADLMDGTPIYDIKPYVPYADAHPEARGGFVDQVERKRLSVDCPAHLLERAPLEKRDALLGVLAEDPRPSYQEDPDRVYGMAFAGMEVKFSVDGERLTVRDIHAAK